MLNIYNLFITVLSMEEQSMADSVKKMDMGNVQLYATAGRGNVHIDIENDRNITLREGVRWLSTQSRS